MKLLAIKANTLYVGLCLVIFTCYGLLYSTYIHKDPILNRDDIPLIYPLNAITSVSGYINDVKNNNILDFQPVRDLSFFINIKIIKWTDISTFHFTNFSIFLLTIFVFMKLLEALGFGRKQVVCSALFYAAHPIMVSAVGWISARKHTLALLFLLLSLLSFVKNKKMTNKMIVFYLLSILSHQIFILFPVWILIYSKIKKIKVELIRFSVMSLMGSIVLFTGILKTFYLEMGNVIFKQLDWFENVSRYVLSIGRSVIQIFLPISISGDYFQGNILNLIGIPIMILGFYILYKSKNRLEPFLWILLAASSHILTYIAFVNDTYLYLPLICVLISLNYYFQSNPFTLSVKIKNLCLVLCLIALMGKTLSASQMWKSDVDLWQYSYQDERSPYTSILLGANLLKHNEKAALDFIVWGVNNYDIINNKNIFLFFLETIYDSSLPIQQKIQIYADCYKDHEVYKAFYALALIQGSEDQMTEGITRIKPILSKIDIKKPHETQGMTIIKALKSICRNVKEKAIACQQLGITY